MRQAFTLDGRLAGDTKPVTSLPLSDLRLMDDSRFPWLILVPRRPGANEITDLDEDDRALLMEEIATVSRALQAATACDKLNVAALGNVVRQLHIHVVARFLGDPAWPGPVWGAGVAVAYRPEQRNRLVGLIRAALPE